MVFQRTTTSPGYKIWGVGNLYRDLTEISGLQLVIEKNNMDK